MSNIEENKKIVEKWFAGCWAENGNLNVIDELADDKLLFSYPMHGPKHGKKETRAMLEELRASFPDVKFWAIGSLIAEGDYVVGRWEGGGTHTGAPYKLQMGELPANTGRKMHFTGTSVIKIQNGKVVEDIGEEGAFAAMKQLGTIQEAKVPSKA
jgi:predicted ester cyclase